MEALCNHYSPSSTTYVFLNTHLRRTTLSFSSSPKVLSRPSSNTFSSADGSDVGGGDNNDGIVEKLNRREALGALAEVGRLLSNNIPHDLAVAVKSGKILVIVVHQYFGLENSPVLGWLLRFGGYKERLLADDLFLTKVAIECGVGIFAKIGTGLTVLLIAARIAIDVPFDGEANDLPILSTSVAYGVFLAVSSNLRYQILAGVIEQRILEPLFHENKLILGATCFAIRTCNTFLGPLMWVAYAHWIGIQTIKE